MLQLSGKVAIVTGASSGIGYETAKLFANEGARLVVTARRYSELVKLVADIERIGGEAVAIAGDIRTRTLRAHWLKWQKAALADSTLLSTTLVRLGIPPQWPIYRLTPGTLRSIQI